MSAHLAVLLAATILDRLVGDPDWLWRRLPHPVAWIGKAIDALDRQLNRETASFRSRRLMGVLAIALLLAAAVLLGLALQATFAALGLLGAVAEILVVAVFLAQKSLVDHVRRVAEALRTGGLAAGRAAVSMIVGRDPDGLDEAGVCRAAIESLAENASDGIVAPWLFFLAFGLPGLLAYKVLNTADSMIGHMSERHRAFGWAAARLDDFANLVPARVTALLFAMVSEQRRRWGFEGHPGQRRVWAIACRDGPLHRSPNAGWPEAAIAAALGLSLGGPRRYGDVTVEAELLHPQGRRQARVEDIDRAIGFLRALSTGLIVFAAGGWLLSVVVRLG